MRERCFAVIKRVLGHAHAPHWAIALFTLLLAIFAFLAWRESRATTLNLERQLIILQEEQRPWLAGGFVGYPPDGPFQLQFVNGGKSPALNVAIFAKVISGAFTDPPQLPKSRCTADCKIDGFVLLSGVPFQMVLLRDQVAVNPIAFRDVPAWIIGRADYEDTQGVKHSTGVCLFHRPESHDLVACPMLNSNYAN